MNSDFIIVLAFAIPVGLVVWVAMTILEIKKIQNSLIRTAPVALFALGVTIAMGIVQGAPSWLIAIGGTSVPLGILLIATLRGFRNIKGRRHGDDS